MLGIHSVQQTLIRCLLCASRGAARGSLGFHQGLAFPRLPTEPPTAAGCPPPPQWAGLPHPSLHPALPRPKSSQVQAETRGSLGIAAGGGGWARSPDTLAAPPTCPQPGFLPGNLQGAPFSLETGGSFQGRASSWSGVVSPYPQRPRLSPFLPCVVLIH